jgi:hypothetical protein
MRVWFAVFLGLDLGCTPPGSRREEGEDLRTHGRRDPVGPAAEVAVKRRWSVDARTILLLGCLGSSACAYSLGQGLLEGAFDEASGGGKSGGLPGTAEALIEKQLLAELGHQLGQGLSAGVTEVQPEQQAKLEQVIDDLLTVAARKTGKGLRNEVSPELREMVQKDIVRALSEGLRGELGASLEDTVDRVVAQAVASLRTSLTEEEMQVALADLLRDSVYSAMREADESPAIGQTLEETLNTNMLGPIDGTLTGIGEMVDRVERSAKRTENTLRGVIGALVVVSSVIATLYFIRNRQVRRLQEQNVAAERGLRNIDAALGELDDDNRAAVIAKLQEYERIADVAAAADRAGGAKPVPRSDEYLRRG